ncbi:MAG: BON domain-containing protein, partial [Pseudomonadota bacterium]
MTRSSKSHTHNAWRSLGYFFIITAGVGLAANAASEEGLAGSSISTTTSSSTDRDLRTRLEGIFREIDGLQRVEVSVSKGVVVLSGEALNDTAVERALQISKRVQGVVSVTDSVSRSFELDSSIQELFNGFENQLLELYRGLPLYALAIVVFCALAWTGKVAANWSSLWNRLSPTPFLAALMAQSVRALTIVIALVVVLDLLGASTLLGTLLGGAGVLSLAIGFAIR